MVHLPQDFISAEGETLSVHGIDDRSLAHEDRERWHEACSRIQNAERSRPE